jgi:hypothetical protein
MQVQQRSAGQRLYRAASVRNKQQQQEQQQMRLQQGVPLHQALVQSMF